MSQGWIVTKHKYRVHDTPESAFTEMDRIVEKTGNNDFYVMRVKNSKVERPDQTAQLPPSLAMTPNIPHEQQTLEQLIAERDYWDNQVTTAPGFASAKLANDFKITCERWIERRKAEAA